MTVNITRELDLARNMFGSLDPSLRKRLQAVLDNPTPRTWDNAYSIIINPDIGLGLTLWKAVIAIDPSYTTIGKSTDTKGNPIRPWAKIPSRDLLIQALQYATH